ncbi:multidrug efflux RND transporter permease subunit [Colwellia sp. 4_MG-2023]|uniref:efflux RND transporter permease subunit n=1 Tax=unclassified Colwellia TaxID=196834 RepID=UPI001C088C67|nr:MULTISPECIES: multidrug efflux RND transporter permease subunit [unclassified Colwellia]MBU2924248.1 efflux RND transporter permease subunit [Colwellia sp. C2M11]MDO6507312.1 multidrug efflux RND transporter permease subunit [Colwellia sp. 5_MG-2023]MDO6556045.1 multidrug efflux RND transporter permease subunit [Colwellia sp. 4_MG-2023]MDO6652959.1 multidrug efflux RND transporter permease subunit [Colwellia sp. 3_MG-2023]MDO6665441.1 multidrug efflux RND transporter permease subunit [Colwe
MKFSHFFIQRPIFAAVLSMLILIAGSISLFQLPVSEYPGVVPPTVVVTASYPGANPSVIAQTVATPLEQEINGIENMLYMSSQATSDGRMSLTVTFALGTDLDRAQVQVQNSVNSALSRLPEEVQRLGVVAEKSTPDLTMVVHLFSPEKTHDTAYLSNYADLYIKDQIARLAGVGDVRLFGGGQFSMRVWLNPDALASRQITASDVISALRSQNQQVAAGSLGSQPSANDSQFQILLNVKGRLDNVEEFEQVIIKVGDEGQVTRLQDVARVELGQDSYSLRAMLDSQPALAIPVFQRPGSNAIELSDQVRETMARLSQDFPAGVEYDIVYDPTIFVRDSIDAVITTLIEAIVLVVIVVILFLQTWRASIIPLIAVPVSLIGTFAVMHWLGVSINTLSLFGLVLAIGIVVDDAIVVVENVERNIETGLSPLEATKVAMTEVTGPIIAIALVLSAVFIPTAFISGVSGQFYKQFALTITISTIISAFNSLTLSPALAAILLKSHDSKPDRLTRILNKLFGAWLFAPFNRLFDRASKRYQKIVKKLMRMSVIAIAGYIILVGGTVQLFNTVPGGFIPAQDKQYLVGIAQLPDAASLDRTEAVVKEMEAIALQVSGVANTAAFPGLSINGFTNSPNSAIVFMPLESFDMRTDPSQSAMAIAAQLNQKFMAIDKAFVAVFPPPPIRGLGTTGGFKLQIEDRGNKGFEVLFNSLQSVINKARQDPALMGLFSSFRVQVPQMDIEIDREQALIQGIPLDEVFDALQIYLGSVYINDFNMFGRTYQVKAQAEAEFRQVPEQILNLKVRNRQGNMVPLGSILTVTPTTGPDRVMHYNGYPSAELNGSPAPGYSSDQAQAAIEKVLAEVLPKDITYEWTEVTYQQILAGNTMVYVFPLVVLLVFMVLAAQYESLRLPLAIILIVPMTIFSALLGVWLVGSDNNIFTQIALIVLVALASKNAILMVEFAKDQHEQGLSHFDAIIESCRLRLRPILMTSIAFTAGVVPLVLATGAGAEMRHAMGNAVFSGMIGVTVFGLLFTPVFYILLTAPKQRTGKGES